MLLHFALCAWLVCLGSARGLVIRDGSVGVTPQPTEPKDCPVEPLDMRRINKLDGEVYAFLSPHPVHAVNGLFLHTSIWERRNISLDWALEIGTTNMRWEKDKAALYVLTSDGTHMLEDCSIDEIGCEFCLYTKATRYLFQFQYGWDPENLFAPNTTGVQAKQPRQ